MADMDNEQLLGLLRIRCEQRFANPRALFRAFDVERASALTVKHLSDGMYNVTGVQLTPQQAKDLYAFFDVDGDGRVNYNDFITVFERKQTAVVRPNSAVGAVTTPSKGPAAGTAASPGARMAGAGGSTSTPRGRGVPDVEPSRPGEAQIGELLGRLQETLARRGTTSIARLAKAFKIIDDDNSGKLDTPEFRKVLREYGFDLSAKEFDTLSRHFDKNNDGTIDYDEFLVGIRGNLSAKRRAAVLRAFQKLDANGNGVIEVDDITDRYCAAKHPDVRSGKKSEAQVLREFLDTFDAGNKDGTVHLDEFEEYYANISASVDSDDYFVAMLEAAWPDAPSASAKRVQASRAAARNASGANKPQLTRASMQVLEVLEMIRQALKRRGTETIADLGKAFRISDDDGSRALDTSEFRKALAERGVDLYDDEFRAITRFFDRNGDGFIDYDEFLYGIRGEMNETRKRAVDEAYRKLDKTGNGVVDYDDIVAAYNAKANPKVRSGEKTERQVLQDFLGNFDTIDKDGVVTKEEFYRYYNDISASIDLDAYFLAMVESSWNTDRKNIARGSRLDM